MFNTDDIARLCGVEPVTVRSWLSRAPAFQIGRRDGRAIEYTAAEAAVFVIAGAILKHRNVRPSDAFPLADYLAHTDIDTAFIEVLQDGSVTASADRPRMGHAFTVMPRGTREWISRRAAIAGGGPRILRATR